MIRISRGRRIFKYRQPNTKLSKIRKRERRRNNIRKK
jgi:hypothetical protein